MNSKDNLMPTNVSSIISNFSDLVKNFSNKETEWQIQKEEYEQRISELEGEVKAHENINIDLLKRIRMLEYALSQERSKNNNKGDNSHINIPQDNSLFNDLGPQNLIKEEDLKFLRETSNRHSMINVLQSIGIDENLANNLFTDFELNRTELEAMIKKNLDEKLAKTGKDNISQIVNNKGNIQNNTSNNNSEDNNEIAYKDKNKSVLGNYRKHKNESGYDYFIKLTRVHGHVNCRDAYDNIAPDIKYSLNIPDKEQKEVYFKTKEEAINFFESIKTTFCKYLRKLGCYGSGDFNGGLPFMDDYTTPWTTDRFCKYFNISDEAKNYIENFFIEYYKKFEK